MRTTFLIGRILFAAIFVLAAPGHFESDTIAYAASSGVPLAKLAVPLSGILALLGGLSIALGYRARWGAWLLVLFLIPVTLFMHDFWTISDPELRQMQLSNFLKNVSLLGGALTFAVVGAGAYSLDARAGRRGWLAGRTAVPA